ncbi:germination protein, Ger(x)C family [Paenibacillus sp. UNC496MF]|uniref:Ger(x)C family spore germination protein n=1 Tax=Paenibacillus sp. UNC496MF TaxID=1502753 RepID=UPI0008E31467|nr:Ger(x)C family spore germination C-terminal domain-containing protein [Paenibacillus sp. UNC496MF]SFI40295.1 germination protein, Ger(x)C family [Paenibacillus sp. UNC496MF]
MTRLRMLLAVMLLLLCTGCWDMREINRLAIVNLTAVDIDPKTGKLVAYYQVINPTSISAKQSGPAKASVYTYSVTEDSPGLFTEKTGTIMSRMLFTPHLQCYVLTERYARRGLNDLINYLEMYTDRRTNVYAVVTDAPLNNVMDTFTPLDRIPGRNLRMLIDWQSRLIGMNRKLTQVKDIAEGIPLSRPTIIPMLHYHGDRPASQSDRVERIEGANPGFELADGAVFVHAKMTGKVDRNAMTLYFVLNGEASRGFERLTVNGADVDVEASHIKVSRHWGPSRLRIAIRADLRVLFNQQKIPLTSRNAREIESAYNRTLRQRAEDFVRLAKDKDWDLLGIGDTRQGRGKWRDVDVTFDVQAKAIWFGNTRTPYQ